MSLNEFSKPFPYVLTVGDELSVAAKTHLEWDKEFDVIAPSHIIGGKLLVYREHGWWPTGLELQAFEPWSGGVIRLKFAGIVGDSITGLFDGLLRIETTLGTISVPIGTVQIVAKFEC